MASSCLAPPVSDQTLAQDIAGAFAAVRGGAGALTEYLDQVVDHRSRQGLRYELGFLLGVVVAATACAGHDEVAAVAQWAADAPGWVLIALGAQPDPLTGQVSAPSESTLRRALAKVDTADLHRLTAHWAQATARATRGCDTDDGGRRLGGVAIDGKSVRGAAAGGGTRPHLLGAVTHDSQIVLAQRQIPDKGSEISELAGLVAELDLAGKVVTVDALHTQRATAEHLVSVKGADYLMTIKANQPSLLAAAHHALSGPAANFIEYTEHSRGHGRTEERIVRTTAVTAQVPIDFPHAAQVFRVIRYVGGLDGQRRSKEVAHCVTSLTSNNADAPDLAGLLREHWGAIENKLHWVRDTTFNEDASTLRAGTAPQAMAIIRNTLIAAFRLAGWNNLKQARRHFSHAISRCVDLITRPVKTVKHQT
ncbi:MAG: ISAs1 family transposase [Actinobacteria bacterium]|nr:ISAs1 family transposase [Actinomycetota bacterium]